MPKPKPRAFLALRKAITGKKATPTELGFKRDLQTSRLIDPKKSAIPKIREKSLKQEVIRRTDLKKRQLTNWISKLNKGLSESGKKTNVSEQKESLFRELFDKEILIHKKQLKFNHVLFEEKLRDAFNSRYYSELHNTIAATGPEKLKDIEYLGAERILNFVSVKLKTQKNMLLLEIKRKMR
ncbi:MAG: hypothetical protein WCX82_01215 [archaeon]